MCFTIFKNKKTPFQAIKKKFKNSKNCHYSKGVSPWFWSKNAHFFNFSFLGNIGQENVFYDILKRKNAFLGYKNNKFRKSKNCHFFKEVDPWFWSKNDHFSNFFFFGKIGHENVFYDILERKNTFLGYKNKKFKKSKNCIILKGLTHGFWTKMAIIAISFYQTNQARKISFTLFQHENTPFQAIKTRSSKSQKIAIFLNWLTYVFGFKMIKFPTSFFQEKQAIKISFTII